MQGLTSEADIFTAITQYILIRAACHKKNLLVQVLHCKCWVDTVTFPVTVTQQSPAAVSMETYQVTIAPMVTKVQTHTWIFAYFRAGNKTNENVRGFYLMCV